MERGLNPTLARQVAVELTRKDAVGAHVRDELGIDLSQLANPWQAALTSMISFALGAAVPLLTLLAFTAFISDGIPRSSIHLLRIAVVATVTLLALAALGALGAWLGGAPMLRAMTRVTVFGVCAMSITYGIGQLFSQ